jgi:hypothetical protein
MVPFTHQLDYTDMIRYLSRPTIDKHFCPREKKNSEVIDACDDATYNRIMTSGDYTLRMTDAERKTKTGPKDCRYV